MSLANNDPETFDKLAQEATEEIAGVLMIPEKALNAVDRYSSAERLKRTLLMSLNALDAYVLLKQAEDILGSTIDITKEQAIGQAQGKSGECLGAKWELKGIRKYEYHDSTLEAMEAQAKELSAKIKERKRLLEALPADVADTATGEMMMKAKKIADGVNIAVTLPK